MDRVGVLSRGADPLPTGQLAAVLAAEDLGPRVPSSGGDSSAARAAAPHGPLTIPPALWQHNDHALAAVLVKAV